MKTSTINRKGLIWIMITWVIITLINYYYVPLFFLVFIVLGLNLTLFILAFKQLLKSIKERNNLSQLRIAKLLTFSLLFLLTFNRSATNLVIEKVDWLVLENKREAVIGQVKNFELNPNVKSNKVGCELPFEFPIVSNGGNDIEIVRNNKNSKTTVIFWAVRSFFNSPSTHFIFSDDPENIKRIEEKIEYSPRNNWKIKDNWYRIYGDW